MGKGRRRAVDFNDPRNVQAFSSLLEDDASEDGHNSQGSSRRKGSRSTRNFQLNPFVFRLREETDAHPPASGDDADQPCSSNAALQAANQTQSSNQAGVAAPKRVEWDALVEMFKAMPRDSLNQAFKACDGDINKTVDFLLGGGSGSETRQRRSSPSRQKSGEQGEEWRAGSWDNLPLDVKRDVLHRLALKDFARVAKVNRELRDLAREMRRRVHHLLVPADISWEALRGIVASYPCADCIDFGRWETPKRSKLQHASQFDSLFRALAQGAAAPHRDVPIRTLLFNNNDAVCAEGLRYMHDHLKTVRSVTLRKCSAVDDSAMTSLSVYGSDVQLRDDSPIDVTMVQQLLLQVLAANAQNLSSTNAVNEIIAALMDHLPEESAAIFNGDFLESAIAVVHANADPQHAMAQSSAAQQAAAADSTAQNKPAADGGAAAANGEQGAATRQQGGLESICLESTDVTDSGVTRLFWPTGRTLATLRNLKMVKCSKLRGEGIQIAPQCVLERLALVRCPNILRIVIQLPATHPLRDISFADCTMLRSLTISAGNLEMLNLGRCLSLTSPELVCGKLRVLMMAQCKALLSFEDVRTPKIEELNVDGCYALTTAAFSPFVSHLPQLQMLRMTNVINVTSLKLEASEGLQQLHVRGARMLQQIRLRTGALRVLLATGCGALEDVRLACEASAIEELDFQNCGALKSVAVEHFGDSSSAAHRAQAPARIIIKGCARLSDVSRAQLKSIPNAVIVKS